MKTTTQRLLLSASSAARRSWGFFRKLALLLCVSLTVGTGLAVAQDFDFTGLPGLTVPPPATTEFKGSFSGTDALSKMTKNIDKELAAMKSSGKLKSLGHTLIGFFLLLNLTWYILKAMATGTGLNGFIADFVSLGLITAVAIAFVDRDIGRLIEEGVGTMAGVVLAEDGASSSTIPVGISGGVEKIIGQTFETIRLVTAHEPAASKLEGWAWLVSILPTAIVGGLATLTMMFFLVTSLCIYIGMLIYSQIALTIALILAPFLVPFVMFPPASFLFDSWLRFILASSMMKLVGGLIAKITGTMMGAMASVGADASKITPGGMTVVDALTTDYIMMASIMLMAGLCAMMMMQIPAISNALVGGSSVGFSGWGSLARSPSAQAMGKAGGRSPAGGSSSDGTTKSKNPNDGNVSKSYAAGRVVASAIRGR